jgi:hypothetical protein
MNTLGRKRPGDSLHHVSFCTLVGVEDVRLQGGDEIVGRWRDSPDRTYGPKRGTLAEEFANCRSDASAILRFTRRTGPLEDKPRPGHQFQFNLDTWRENQRGFRWFWSMAQEGTNGAEALTLGRMKDAGFETVIEFTAEGWRLPVEREDQWTYSNSQLEYQAGSILRFLFLDLLSCQRERLRKCVRPGCDHPYFVAARDLRQTYCSQPCSAWAQREWKRKWWAEHGRDWLHSRSKHRDKRGRART